jgi:hypothetical protein
MQNETNQFFSDVSPQTFGAVDPHSMLILTLSLIAPGLIVGAILYLGRELLRPRWRGYWDKV